MTRVLVFLHGFMGDPSDWDFMRSALTEYEIVTPTIRPAADWATGVAQLRREIPADAVLIGYSMGARLSLALAVAEPQRYQGLVFCSGDPGIEDEGRRAKRYVHDGNIAERIDGEDRAEFLHSWYTESTVFR